MEQRARQPQRTQKVVLAILVALAALLAVAALGLVVPQDAGARGVTPAGKLADLRVRPAGTMAGYERTDFPHRSDARDYGWRLCRPVPPTPAPAT